MLIFKIDVGPKIGAILFSIAPWSWFGRKVHVNIAVSTTHLTQAEKKWASSNLKRICARKTRDILAWGYKHTSIRLCLGLSSRLASLSWPTKLWSPSESEAVSGEGLRSIMMDFLGVDVCKASMTLASTLFEVLDCGWTLKMAPETHVVSIPTEQQACSEVSLIVSVPSSSEARSFSPGSSESCETCSSELNLSFCSWFDSSSGSPSDSFLGCSSVPDASSNKASWFPGSRWCCGLSLGGKARCSGSCWLNYIADSLN